LFLDLGGLPGGRGDVGNSADDAPVASEDVAMTIETEETKHE